MNKIGKKLENRMKAECEGIREVTKKKELNNDKNSNRKTNK